MNEHTTDVQNVGDSKVTSVEPHLESTASNTIEKSTTQLEVLELQGPSVPGENAGYADGPEQREAGSAIGRSDLAHFLSRPVLVLDFGWDPTFSPTFFNPWATFLNDAEVKKKIGGFRALRGDLEITIVSNGSPFHSGRLLVAYRPNFAVNSAYSGIPNPLNCTLTQCPNVLIDPMGARSSEMSIPFISPDQYIDLTDATASQMGHLFLRELAPLRQENVVSIQPVNVQVYITMKNVELFLPSQEALPTFLSGNSAVGKKKKKKSSSQNRKDEYSMDGPVSSMATKVQEASNLLTDVPYIGSFANIASQAAGKIASIASIFGWSKPVLLDKPMFVKPQNFAPLSVSEWHDTSYKLSLDTKQEISPPAAETGVDLKDELAIAEITSKWSYLTSFDWSTSDVVTTPLLEVPVDPLLMYLDGGYYPTTTVAFAALPFSNWRGTLKYKLIFSANTFHRGRVRITYFSEQLGTRAVSPPFNTSFSQVLDLHNGLEYEFCVGYTQAEPYLSLEPPILSGANTGDATRANGWFRIDVQIPLRGAEDPTTITGLLFVAAGEDFQLANPSIGRLPREIKSTFLSGGPDHLEDDAEVIEFELVPTMAFPKVNSITFGETIQSFRPLAKRFCYYTTPQFRTATRLFSTGTTWVLAYTHQFYPHLPANDSTQNLSSTGPDIDSLSNDVSYANWTYVSYLLTAYAGVRGGMRYKIAREMPAVPTFIESVPTVSRIPNESLRASADGMTIAGNGAGNFNQSNLYTGRGSAIANGGTILPDFDQGGVMEFELPYYSPHRFAAIPWLQGGQNNAFLLQQQYYKDPLATMSDNQFQNFVNIWSPFSIYAAGADDFCPFLFRGGPVLSDDPTTGGRQAVVVT